MPSDTTRPTRPTRSASRPEETAADAVEPLNEVRLRGRLSGEPEERVLPSGDTLVSFRVVVERPPGARARVDTVDCSAFRAGVRRTVLRWRPGDAVEVQGALHRRFYAGAAGRASRYEVEVVAASRAGRGRTGAVAP